MFLSGQESSAPYSLPSISSFHNGSNHAMSSGVAPSYGHSSPAVSGLDQSNSSITGGVTGGSQTGAALGRALASVSLLLTGFTVFDIQLAVDWFQLDRFLKISVVVWKKLRPNSG